MQLEELKLIPAKSEKEAADLTKQLEKLQADKAVQEDQLKAAMESFKHETGVSNNIIAVNSLMYAVQSLHFSTVKVSRLNLLRYFPREVIDQKEASI